MRWKTTLVSMALTLALSSEAEEKQDSSLEQKRKSSWVGQWSPSPIQDFTITKDFKLSFSDDFILPYLRGKQFELHLQEDDGDIGAEEIVEKRHMIFLLNADDQDPSRSWLSIIRVDKIEGVRTMKKLYTAHFSRLPNQIEPAKN